MYIYTHTTKPPKRERWFASEFLIIYFIFSHDVNCIVNYPQCQSQFCRGRISQWR